MEIFLILFLIGAGAAGKAALDHVGDSYRESKTAAVKAASGKNGGKLSKSRRAAVAARHAQGFWAGEILHGFPMARRGWHAGWLAHKAAADHQKALREEARTTHLETRASVLSGIPEHRKRQAEARALIEKALAEHPDATSKKAVEEAAGAVVLPWRPRTAPLPSETVGRPEPGPYAPRPDARPGDSSWLNPGESRCELCDGTGRNKAGNDACPACRGWGGAAPEPGAPEAPDGTICTACGHPSRHLDPVLDVPGGPLHESHVLDQHDAYQNALIDARPAQGAGAAPSPATNGASTNSARKITDDGMRVATIPWQQEAALGSEATPNGNGAGHMTATDTTFNSVLQASRGALAQSDQDTALIRQRKEQAYAVADEMVASHVDPVVIEAQMNYADALAKAEEALAGAGEHAGNTASSLERYHGGMQEAVDSAPGQVAEREFHEGA